MEGLHNVAFIGAGNLAWHLAPELENQGHKVSLVYNRSKKNANQLIPRLYNASYHKNLDFSRTNVDVLIVAVKDDVIPALMANISLPDNCFVYHTSGTQKLNIFNNSSAKHYGVLYPLQTFTKGIKVNIRDTPFFVEASDKEAIKVLEDLTRGVTRYVYQANSEQRSILHLSAVIGSNFTNHMLTIAKTLMDKHNMDFGLLKNVITSTFQKAFESGPEIGQTGPAIRGDLNTIRHHLKLLKDDRDLKQLYKLITEHIIKSNS